MSSLFVKIVNYTLSPHSNADSLSLANPLGTSWQCVVKTANFEPSEGKLAVYIPIDSMLPSKLAAALGLPNVKEGKPYRIKTIKLRGEVSQGLLVPLKELIALDLLPPTYRDPIKTPDQEDYPGENLALTYLLSDRDWQAGDDVAAELGISKYVEPEPEDRHSRREPEGFVRYTDIENIKNFPDVLAEGEEVIATEKIHGSNFRAGWVEVEKTVVVGQSEESGAVTRTQLSYDFIVGTRRTALKAKATEDGDLIAENRWLRAVERYGLEEKLRPYPGYVVFGEVYGPGVQKLAYAEEKVNLRLFDVWDGKRYLDYDDFELFAAKIGVPVAPPLYFGPYSEETVLPLRSGKTVTGGGVHIREGIVIRPVKERWEKRVGRVILKSVSEDYLMGNFEGE
jgi:RNA ligase (TIGR02306 family)